MYESRQIPQKLASRLELVLLFIFRSWTIATYSAIEKALADCKKISRWQQVARAPYVV